MPSKTSISRLKPGPKPRGPTTTASSRANPFSKAAPFLRDALIFPYLGGRRFIADNLKPTGWEGLSAIFTKPPVSTQQIMHPALYTSGRVPAPVSLPSMEKVLGADWAKLEENVMGEFGWKEVLKHFLDEPRAKALSASWDGDRYAVYEQRQTKRLLLITRERLATQEQTQRFFGQYSEALEKKHETRSNLFRKSDFFSFDTPGGGVFLRCFEKECVTLEGGDRALLHKLNKELQWPPVPEAPKILAKDVKEVAVRPGAAGGAPMNLLKPAVSLPLEPGCDSLAAE